MEQGGVLRRIRRAVKRPRNISARLMIVSSVITVLGFSAVCGSVMLDMRRASEELARQTLGNLASSVDADVDRNIELYDLSLRAVAANLLLPQLRSVDADIRQLIVFDRSAAAAHFGAIQVFDAHGDLVLDASSVQPEKINRAGEAYFAAHRDNAGRGLYISQPTQHQGVPSIVLSRRVSAADGSFLGVVAGSIRFSYFEDLFGRLHLAPHDMIAVISHDGTLVMRAPFVPELIGKNMLGTPGAGKIFETRRGWFAGTGTLDHVDRLFVWTDSTKPLVVVVAKSWDDILAIWRREAAWIAAILLGLAVIVAGFTVFFIREIDRRAAAERRLEELATTDPLTGLTNRRKFDAAIDGEWRRAVRQGTPVALLMIDADHFKNYNDSHGHQAGDEVLVGIALCIADTVHRAGDCAARFGGEEFAVLLPGLVAGDALLLAETVRHKVERWSAEQGGVTISIGVASMMPAIQQDWSTLISAADRALYAAKDCGRNRCVVTAGHGDVSLAA